MSHVHPRELLVNAARRDLATFMCEFLTKHKDLTYIEQAQIFAQETASCLKYALRVERHGNDSTPAGLES